MRVCSKCGKPDEINNVCVNCGSTIFKMIGINTAKNIYPNQPVQIVNPNNGYNSVVQATGTAVKTTSVAKIVVPIIIAIIVAIVGIVTPIAIRANNTPEKTIEKFEAAYNEMDLNGCIDCFDSKTRRMYKAGSNLLGEIIGFDISSAAELLPFSSELIGEEKPTISIIVLDKNMVSSDVCILSVNMSTNYDEVENEEIKMVKENGDWYISGDSLF